MSAIDRAEKLLALTESPNENEARNAAMKLCEMIRARDILLASNGHVLWREVVMAAVRGMESAVNGPPDAAKAANRAMRIADEIVVGAKDRTVL